MPETESGEYVWHAFRVGRAQNSAEVRDPENGGSRTIEEGTIDYELIERADEWLWEEEQWQQFYTAPDGGVGFDGGAVVLYERLGILELPEPMTREEAHEWLEEVPERWQQFVDDTIECDVTASDVLEGSVR